ncbi:MAG: hypothetical protein H0V14_08780 [Chitinophagaceae bacterium]|nr:hypothetical protein [Chitinophagaceae bacterium]
MKIIATFLSLVFFVSCVNSKEKSYTASTPAAPIVRSFLGIPLTDSVDFIRWKLTLANNQYKLECNYGIGKSNTNGFYNGGEKIALTGVVKNEKNYYQLQNDNKTLSLVELNADLLHLLDADDNLLVGNGGWSYVLNNITPMITDQINITARQTILKDSMAFEGRTPCGVPDIIASDMECYKLKWYVVFYANAEKNESTTYRVFGTPYRKEGGKTGTWKIIKGRDGRIIYQLNDEKENAFIYLLKLGEGVLIFTDVKGNLLVGDLDFSYTLNRKF